MGCVEIAKEWVEIETSNQGEMVAGVVESKWRKDG
jgi:hypothetical protein